MPPFWILENKSVEFELSVSEGEICVELCEIVIKKGAQLGQTFQLCGLAS